MNTEAVSIDRDAVTTYSTDKNEPKWLSELRLEGIELANDLELPKLEKTRIDRWNLSNFGQYKPAQSVDSVLDLPAFVQPMLSGVEAQENLLIQHNSGVVYGKISEQLAEQGVIFTDLETAVRDHGDLVQKYFMTALKKDENRLTALHTALWSGGVFLYVPKNVEIEFPLQAMFLTDDLTATFSPHIIIVAEEFSRVTYVDHYISGDLAGNKKRSESTGEHLVHSGVVEVFVKPGAMVRYASVRNMDENIIDLSYRRAIVENDAEVDWVIGEMNYGNVMSDTTSILKGNGSYSDVKIICVGSDEQKLSITTQASHFGKNTDSKMTTRAVLRDRSTAILNGITKIEKHATKSNGEQVERILMLSPTSRGDANPILLIDEDDVKAGHAASVGQIDPEHVHYLMSRGLPRSEAERLIVYGFLAPVVAEIPIEQLAEQLRGLVERKLG